MSVLQKYEENPPLRKAATACILLTLLAFLLIPFLEEYRFDPARLQIKDYRLSQTVIAYADTLGMPGKTYASLFAFARDVNHILRSAQHAQESLNQDTKEERFDNWTRKEYLLRIVKASGVGIVSSHPLLFLFVLVGLGIVSGILIATLQLTTPGNNNHTMHAPLTRGVGRNTRNVLVIMMFIAILCYGYFYMQGDILWPVITCLIAAIIIILVYARNNSMIASLIKGAFHRELLPILVGTGLIGFYILLYWAPWYVVPWTTVMDPFSRLLNGNVASQWFLYGVLYTFIVLVMGMRMVIRYRNNTYQVIRSCSVMFFQTAFAFLLPEILVRLNQPYFDFKHIWPLNYTFFFDWNLNTLMQSGGLGIFMLVWGIVLIVIAVPLFTYFYGKRWYCSWVCGCGGLAETFGDPFRHLSNKSLKAWKYERWIVHGVLVFAVLMTAMVLYTYFTGERSLLFMNSDSMRTWYGFFIGSAFAGVVGTGFYPMMGSRVWCRFGCPLAAYIGLIQRFKSRFRITVNGGQCISCGNCSTYCEMGIDVRQYAQRGQDIVRASCVGCGICASVCPRGVLRLENVSADIDERASVQRTIHIHEGDVRLLN